MFLSVNFLLFGVQKDLVENYRIHANLFPNNTLITNLQLATDILSHVPATFLLSSSLLGTSREHSGPLGSVQH